MLRDVEKITASEAREIMSEHYELSKVVYSDIKNCARLGRNCLDFFFTEVDKEVAKNVIDELKENGYKVSRSSADESEIIYVISW